MVKMYDNILIPTDGSECSMKASKYAARIGEKYDATLHVLFVMDFRGYKVQPGLKIMVEELRKHGENVVDDVGDNIKFLNPDLDIKREVVKGVPFRQILDYAEENDIDLITMGTHGRTGLDRVLIGSTTEKVVRASRIPVLTVGENQVDLGDGFEEVLIPSDGSEGALKAIEQGLDIAKKFDASVHVLHVVDTRIHSYDDVFSGDIDELLDEGEKVLDEVSDRAKETGIEDSKFERHLKRGIPHKEIVKYAEENDIDLIMMGTHGRTGLDRFLIGSTTEKVVRTSMSPVLTIGPE